MNNKLLDHVKNTIKKSIYDDNVFDSFIKLCQDYYDKPVHSLQEMKEVKNTKIKGDIFEHFCYLYMKHVMNYDVWFLKDVPNNVLKELKLGSNDLGIDLIAKDKKGYIAIQVKYRKPSTRKTIIGWKDLSTFFAIVSRTGPFKKHIVFTNASGIRHVGEKSDKDKSICIGSLRKIKKECWLNMVDFSGKKLIEPVNESVIEPVNEPVIEPVNESVIESVIDSVIEPVIDSVIEPVIEPVVEPVNELKTELDVIREKRIAYYENLFYNQT